MSLGDIGQRNWFLVIYERLHGVFGADCRDYDHRCEFSIFFLRRAWLFIFGLGVSIGSCIAEMLMFRRCIDRTGVIDIRVES